MIKFLEPVYVELLLRWFSSKFRLWQLFLHSYSDKTHIIEWKFEKMWKTNEHFKSELQTFFLLNDILKLFKVGFFLFQMLILNLEIV